MNPNDERTPPLPKELSVRSPWKAFLGCLYAVFLWVIPCYLVGAVFVSSLPLLAKIAIALPLGLVGGYGILLSGFMGHDGTHFTLHESKLVSSLIGIAMTSPVVPYFLMGFTISHWNHHRYTNTESDPDAAMFSRFKNIFSRALLARPYSFYEYGGNTFRLALGIPLPFAYSFPLDGKTLKLLARLNLLANGLMAALHLFVCFTFPAAYLGVLFVFACGSVVSGLSPFIEHTGTGLGRGKDTRTSFGAWWDIFLLGNNYHIEHHLYPTVPFYNLKRATRYLAGAGFYERGLRHTSSGVLDTYRYTLGRYPYPSAAR